VTGSGIYSEKITVWLSFLALFSKEGASAEAGDLIAMEFSIVFTNNILYIILGD
jgi:hypothetical protein